MPWFGMFFGPIMMIGFILMCVMIVMFVMRGRGMGMPWVRSGTSDPFEILRERFARGEIDRAECEERKRVLSQM